MTIESFSGSTNPGHGAQQRLLKGAAGISLLSAPGLLCFFASARLPRAMNERNDEAKPQ